MLVKLYTTLLLFVSLSSPLAAQGFGKNKIQYDYQRWHYIQSKHYDIYYYDGGLPAAEFTAAVAESAYVHISKVIGYKMQARSVIILYNSHNDFEETNLSSQIQDESVGGFTEFFKNRVTLPYDGSAEGFRHVIHHELTHALQLQFFYGTGPGSIITGITGFMLPSWFAEGSAEYFSRRWDSESDNFIRDAVLSNYLQPIPFLNGFLAYKGGQAFLYWVERKYGIGKIAQLNRVLKQQKNVERTFKTVFGMTQMELTKVWHEDMKELYWPEIASRQKPVDFAEAVTDHQKDINFVNNSPALSPDGSRLAYLSDNNGAFYIHVLSTVDGKKAKKLIGGQKENTLEEFKWLRPGISWSPDGQEIVFAAKAGHDDVLYIVDSFTGKKIKKLVRPELNGVWSPAWSPQGNLIAFMGTSRGQSDIYTWDIENNAVRNLTDDRFSDLEPAWSPDGKIIAFTSDRSVYSPQDRDRILPAGSFDNTDIYIISKDGGEIEQITTDPYSDKSPVFYGSADTLLFVSDRNGIDNIYVHFMSSGLEKPMTNLISGANQLTTSANTERLAFTSFYAGGYDIYLSKDPFSLSDTLNSIPPTAFRKDSGLKFRDFPEIFLEDADSTRLSKEQRPFRKFVFDDDFKKNKFTESRNSLTDNAELPENERLLANGQFIKRHYTPKFTLDYVGGYGGYDPFWGVQGYTQFIVSDLLGNHRVGLGLNIIRSLANSDAVVSWAYLPRRWDVGLQAFHFSNYYNTGQGIERLQHMGGQLNLQYPFNRFKRLELNFGYTYLREQNLLYDLPIKTTKAIPSTLALVADNTDFRFYGPYSGTRYKLSFFASPDIASDVLSFYTGLIDFRHYIPITRESNLAVRLSGGYSGGRNPYRFILGGQDNWLNYDFARGLSRIDITDFYFSQITTPLRGYDYYEQVGTRYFLFNAEFRFPLVDYFIMRFPLPLWITNIRGAAFTDIGSAWEDEFRASERLPSGKRRLKDVAWSYGWGFRVNLGIFLLRMDAAWRSDILQTSKPNYLFSIGTDF
ncbi:MAG: hypothetical protein DWQ05_13720 [Calditrichaeota bacterium]|nr:MAG: hypothetical protein DWQ05_13720 [Calditrichota bacterium]